MNKSSILFGIALSGLGVAFGAFGAHALEDFLKETGRTATFETAVKYQFYHGLALILLGILQERIPHEHMSQAAMAVKIGTVIFSGSLYILCLTQMTWLGMVTPFGGTALILGWALAFWAVFNSKLTK